MQPNEHVGFTTPILDYISNKSELDDKAVSNMHDENSCPSNRVDLNDGKSANNEEDTSQADFQNNNPDNEESVGNKEIKNIDWTN
jgi:hypothetical protein